MHFNCFCQGGHTWSKINLACCEKNNWNHHVLFSGYLTDLHIHFLSEKITNKADLRDLGVLVLDLQFDEVDQVYSHLKDTKYAAVKLLQTWKKNQKSSKEAFIELHAKLKHEGWDQMAYELEHICIVASQENNLTPEHRRKFPATKKFIQFILIILFALGTIVVLNMMTFQLEYQGPQIHPTSNHKTILYPTLKGEGTGLTPQSKKHWCSLLFFKFYVFFSHFSSNCFPH